MFATNHVLSGALIGQVLNRRPKAAFLVGLASHLLLDVIPHWGCELERPGASEEFLRIAKRDGVLGISTMVGVTLTVEERTRLATVAAMVGAVFLDLDKPCEFFLGVNPFPRIVRRVHALVQREAPDRMKSEIVYGMLFAIVDVVLMGRSQRMT